MTERLETARRRYIAKRRELRQRAWAEVSFDEQRELLRLAEAVAELEDKDSQSD